MANTFLVRKDNTIDVTTDFLTDADIREVYESLSACVVFRIAGDTVEYAYAGPVTKKVIWKKAHKV